MFPLLPFAVGLLTGAAGIRLLRNEKAKKQLDKAQDRLREATVSSLTAIESSSARLRTRLDQPAAATPPTPPAAPAKAPRKRAAPRQKTAVAAAKGATKRVAKATATGGGEA